MTWTELITASMDETYKATDGLMSLVDDDKLVWKPTTGTNWMTTGQLLMHLVGSCGLCFKGFVTGDWGLPDDVAMSDIPKEDMLPAAEKLPTTDSVAEARRQLDEDQQLALLMLAESGEERLNKEKLVAPWDPSGQERALGEHLLGMVGHLSIHRAQLFYYLKLQGKDVNTSHLWGM